MASSHPDDDDLFDDEIEASTNPHASATRWRHQESSAFARHAGGRHNGGAAQPVARDADVRGHTSDLADFLNASRISPSEAKAGDAPSTPRFTPIMAGASEAREAREPAPTNGDVSSGAAEIDSAPTDGKHIICGPLLNYRRMEDNSWIGSVLVVVKGGGKTQPFVPSLELRRVGAVSAGQAAAERTDDGERQRLSPPVRGICLYSDPRNTFWRFDLFVPLEPTETEWEYTLPDLRFGHKAKPQRNSFFVPAVTESMRIMFHSCNGFSVGTDVDAWSGPVLWKDVLRRHREAPFHVMIGGGDQIYNDGIRVDGPLRSWTEIANPKKRRDYPFPEALRTECDEYYRKNYIRW